MTLCKIGNKMGIIPFKISVRCLVFREIEIRNIFRITVYPEYFRIPASRKTKHLTEILTGMNPV